MSSTYSFILMPTIGASIHVIQKFLFECESVGVQDKKKFHKPFFFTWLGSFGLFIVFLFNILVNFFKNGIKFCFGKHFISSFLQIGISTSFNLVAGTLSNISALYLNYSTSLMLRSSTLIFGAIVTTFFLKRPLKKHQIIGIFITLLSILIISLAAMFSGSSTSHIQASSLTIAMYVVIRTLSKSLQAISMLIEEKLMKSTGISPIDVAGISGIWSVFLSTLLLRFEGTYDTYLMIKNNKTILYLSLMSILVFALWSVLALVITSKASAVARMVFDQLTIVVVWIVQLGIYQFFSKSKGGEEWTKMSWIQLLGFSIMIFGALVYQRVIRLIEESTSSSVLLEEETH